MNGANDPAWSGAEQFDQGVPDFGNILDFDSLNHFDLDFPLEYQNTGLNNHDTGQQVTSELAQSLDAHHLFSPHLLSDQHNGGAGAQQQQRQQQHGTGNGMQAGSNSHFFDFSMPQFSANHMYRPHAGVPPTPNSTEMHGDPAQYLQQMQAQGLVIDHDFHMRKEDASFTPLVSPAVTPYENRSHIPDFTITPGAYFSPLTSPALTAQEYQQAQLQSGQYTNSGSSTDASPLDVEMSMNVDVALAQADQSRRLRGNKRSAPGPATATGRVRQSPIVKPTRRKATVPAFVPPKDVSEVVEEAHGPTSARPSSTGLEVPRSSESSEFDSVSPERLSDMGPPPLPGSVSHSPAVFAQGGQAVCPATPASLMRLQQSPNFSGTIDGQPMLDDLMLPEASCALDRPSLSRIDTAVLVEDGPAPHTSSRKTPKLTPLSTPSAGVALSGKPSPLINAAASPMSPAFAQVAGKRIETKTGRNSKKRNSVSSTLVSPAIRPKISPSIKPLTSEGGGSTDAHTLLLASKSNYQNILEGNTVPGVSYPTSLATNLTSKRTSHKIAEQGRRNRINTALQEMQALLPPPKPGSKEAADAKSPDMTAAQSANSKAAKVESAIEYIKQLQKEVSERDNLLSKREQEMETLRKELESLKKGESSTNSASPAQSAEEKKMENTSSQKEQTTT